MKKLKSILAVIGVIALVSLYVATFIFAIVDDPRTFRLLGVALGATFIIPITIWVIGIFTRLSSPTNYPVNNSETNKENGDNDSEEQSK